MRNYHFVDSKIVIHCLNCRNKLRVPVDKGKISVKCPVCAREFYYNPNSIFDTLKQAAIFTISKFPRDRKSRIIAAIGASLILLIAVLYLLYGNKTDQKIPAPNTSPKFSIASHYSVKS